MKEQEYIDVSDRVKVSNALYIIRDIVPENSSVVTPNEYRRVVGLLALWEAKLFPACDTYMDEDKF